MISRVLQESFIVRFLKRLYVYAQNSYVFHFDFKVEVKKEAFTKQKPLGFIESLLRILERGCSALSKETGLLLDGSLLFRIKKSFLVALQQDSIGSVLYFGLGFLALIALKTMNTKLILPTLAYCLFTVFIYPIIVKYKNTSMLFKAFNAFLTGGDQK